MPSLGLVLRRGSLPARTLGALVRFAHALDLEKAVAFVVRRLPEHTQDWVAEATRVARKPGGGTLEQVVSIELVDESYRRATSLLLERKGPDGDFGDYLEFGVYTGTIFGTMHQVLEDLGLDQVRMFGFDSFEGLPEEARTEGDWRPGMYRSSLEETRDSLTRRGVDWSRATLVEGWFSDSLTDELVRDTGLRKAAVIMIDCDIYSSTCTALEFCAPLIVDETLVFFDEWEVVPEGALGEEHAFAEFLAANPELSAEELEGLGYSAGARAFLVTRRAAPAA